MKFILIILYTTAIIMANVLTASLSPAIVGPFIIPMGTFLIGATFILRDLVQNAIGKRNAYAVIAIALALSALTSYLLGDTLWITFASAATFAISETVDTEAYSRIKSSLAQRVFFSGLVGGTLDSAVFVIIGLSPLGAGFIPWQVVPIAVISQLIVKLPMQAIAAYLIQLRRDAA